MRPDFDKVRSAQEHIERAERLNAGDDDLVDDVRDQLATAIQELAEAYGVSERGVEAIRSILVDSEATMLDYERAHELGHVLNAGRSS